MKIEEFIDICRNSGHCIKNINGYYFRSVGWRNYSYPLDNKIPVDEQIVKMLKWKYLITIICTESPIRNSYEFVLKTDSYSIEKFSRKIRNRINKSLLACKFRRPSLMDMQSYGFAINIQTLQRQYRKDRSLTDIKLWNNYIESLYSRDDINILGAYYNGRMVGYLIASDIENKSSFLNAFIDRQDADITCPMNGLLYTMINQLIVENGSVNISYGLETFSPRTELDRFKSNMLFEKVPTSRVYIINPLLLLIIKLIIYFNINLLKRKRIKNPFVTKIIRLYQGYRILTRKPKI